MTDSPAGIDFSRLIAKSVAVCVFGGALFGSVAWILIMSVGTQSVYGVALLPFLPLFALPITLVLGSIAAPLGAWAIWRVQGSRWQPKTLVRWVLLGAALGLVLGAVLPLLLRLAGLGLVERDYLLVWTLTGATAGTGCGTLLAHWTAKDVFRGTRGRPTTR